MLTESTTALPAETDADTPFIDESAANDEDESNI